MNTLRDAAKSAIDLICQSKLCEINSMSSRAESIRLLDKAIDTLRKAVAEAEGRVLVPSCERISKRQLEYALNCLGIDNALNTPDFELAENIWQRAIQYEAMLAAAPLSEPPLKLGERNEESP